MSDTGVGERERQGATLRRLRRWVGLSQREVADAIGVSDAAYGFWEAGKAELRLRDVQRLAEAFEIPLTTLLRSLGYDIEQDAPTLGTWMESTHRPSAIQRHAPAAKHSAVPNSGRSDAQDGPLPVISRHAGQPVYQYSR